MATMSTSSHARSAARQQSLPPLHEIAAFGLVIPATRVPPSVRCSIPLILAHVDILNETEHSRLECLEKYFKALLISWCCGRSTRWDRNTDSASPSASCRYRKA